MYLIINDQSVRRFVGAQITIGRGDHCDLFLKGPQVDDFHCQLIHDPSDEWLLKQHSHLPTRINGMDIRQGDTRRISYSDDIKVGTYHLTLLDSDRNSAIAQAVRQKLFDLQAALHRTILDVASKNASGLASNLYRKRIESELDKQLGNYPVPADLELYLATAALREMLGDDVFGFGRSKRGRYDDATYKSNLQQFGRLLPTLKEAIEFDPNETQSQKAERIEVLLPWAVRVRQQILPPSDRHRLAIGLLREQLLDIIYGLGPLEDLMDAPNVTDIMVLPSGLIYIERGGQIQDSGRKMLSDKVSELIIGRIVSDEGRHIDKTSPMVDARMRDGSRLNATVDPVTPQGPTLTIRRFASRPYTIEALVENETVTQNVANFLRACILARKNMLFSGGTGAGKTTLLNAFASAIPANQRIITVEDTAEIKLPQAHVITMQARPPNIEGQNTITIRDLVRNALRMRPDRIIVGECRGGEALDMLQAMNTGHEGSITTIHANWPPDAVRRLEVMSLEAAGVDLPARAIREQIASAIDLIIQVARFSSGARRVTSIYEVVEIDEDDGSIILEEIFTLRKCRFKGGMSHSELAFTGYVPTFVDELIQTGVVKIGSLF